MGAADPILFDLDDIQLEDIEPWQVDHVGAELAAARMAKGIAAETLASDLKIRASFVTALESGRYSDLPGLPYAIGYVRSIADYLGLDGEAVARTFKEQQGHNYVAPTLALPEPEEIREGGSPKMLLAAISLALGTVGYGGWMLYSQPGPAELPVAARPAAVAPVAAAPASTTPSKAVADGSAKATPVAAGPATTPKAPEEVPGDREAAAGTTRIETIAPAATSRPKPETPPERAKSLASAPIVLEARGLTWVHLKDAKGATVVAGAKKKGWRFTLPDRPGLRLTVGRANQLVIRVGDRALPPLRPDGQPVRNVALDAAKLKQKAEALGR